MKTFITLIVLALGTAVLAHSSLVSSTPADDSTVSKRRTSMSLTFSEKVETGLSSFVVYPLGKADADHEAFESEAEALLARVLSKPDKRQVDVLLDTQGTRETVTLSLPENLAPGTHAVMWRALSVDTHTL